jgi:hypothetical protein
VAEEEKITLPQPEASIARRSDTVPATFTS